MLGRIASFFMMFMPLNSYKPVKCWMPFYGASNFVNLQASGTRYYFEMRAMSEVDC